MSQMADYNSVDPPTRVQTWKMLNEAWGYVTGDLNAEDFASDTKIQENHLKFVESGHDHDGAGSHAISSDSIGKKNFDLQTCNIAWGVYFQETVSGDGASNRHTYMLLGGTGSISVSSGGGSPPIIAGVSSGDATIVTGCATEIHIGTDELNDRDTSWAVTDLVGAIASPRLDTDEMACYMMEVETTSAPDKFVAYCLDKDSPSTVNYDYIMVMRVSGSEP